MRYNTFAWTAFVTLFFFPSPMLALAMPETRLASSISACTDWLNARSVNDEPIFHSISKKLGCYNGGIEKEPANDLVEWLSKSASDKPLLVIRSRGGVVAIGLEMGRAIAAKEAAVVVFDVCGSSCANYVFGIAKQRIILPGSLVLFHGGMSEAIIAEGMNNAREKVPAMVSDPNRAAENIRKIERTFRAKLEDQRALMRQAGVVPEFFERYRQSDILSLPDDQCTQGNARNFVFLTEDQYRRLGIEVSGEIVNSIDRAEEIIAGLHIGDTAICFAPEILLQKQQR